MIDDSKQSVSSYDATHRMEQLDEFTDQTIAQVDDYLRGEREHEMREAMQRPAQLLREACEPWDAEASDPSGWTQAEKEAYAQCLDEEFDAYWSEHCVKHGDELRHGRCYECDAELADVVRNDY